MKIGIVLGGLTLAGLALVAATPRPVQDAAAQEGVADQAAVADRMVKSMVPGEQHAGLAQLVGKWDLELKIAMEPGLPMETVHATSEIESVLGGRYIIEEVESGMGGQLFKGISITGYDALTDTFVSVWMDNDNTAMTIMKGKGEADGEIIWRGERNDPTLGMVSVRGVQKMTATGLTFENYDTIGGKEVKVLEIVYTRAEPAPGR